MFRRKRRRSPKIRLLETVVDLRLAITRLKMLEQRLERTKRLQKPEEKTNLDKVIQEVKRLQLVLEAVALRLETIATTGVYAIEELTAAKHVLQSLRKEYKQLIPGLDAVLSNIIDRINSVARDVNIELPDTITPPATTIANEILESVSSEKKTNPNKNTKIKE